MQYAAILVIVASITVLGGCQTTVARPGSSGVSASVAGAAASSSSVSSSGTGGASTAAAGTSGSSTGRATASGGTTASVIPVTTLAGGGGATCVDAGFDGLTDVRLGPSGGIYVIGGQVYSVASDGTITSVIASSVLPTMDFMAIGPTGAFFLSASNAENFSQVFQIDGSTASLLAGNGGAVCGDSGSDAGVGFGAISGMLVDPGGDLVVTETTVAPQQKSCDNVRRITSDGTTTTVAGSGTPGYANGSASQTQFEGPAGIVIDSQGNIIVADSGNNRIRTIAPDGTTSTLAGNGAPGFQDGSGAGVAFDHPIGLAIDGQDNLYVADTENNRIREVTPQGVTSTVAGNGVPGFLNGTLGPEGTAEFDLPSGIAVNAAGTIIYVADDGNCALRVITLPAL